LHPPDDKLLSLARPRQAPQPRRAVRKNDFSLPKPYQRRLFSEEPERLTRLQKGLLAFATLLVATLAAVMALLAHENARSPRGKVIVAAARLESLEPPEPPETQLLSYPSPAPMSAAPAPASAAPPIRATPPALAGDGPALPAPPVPRAVRAKAAKPARKLVAASKQPLPRARAAAALLAREKKSRPRPLRKAPVRSAPPADPDVVLITAILLLAPAPAPAAASAPPTGMSGPAHPACPSAGPRDTGCANVQPAKP
jgi:hypothetical protein